MKKGRNYGFYPFNPTVAFF